MRGAGSPSSLTLAGILLLTQACGGEPEQAAAAAVEAPPFELRPAVEQALSGLPGEAIPAPLSGDAAEEVLGLCQLAAGNPKLVEVAREDAARLGPGGAASLERHARDRAVSAAERAAAIDLLDPAIEAHTDALARLASDRLLPDDKVPDDGRARMANDMGAELDPWVRARAAWRLAEGGFDHVVPTLCRRLKYEKDHTTVVWLASALAKHQNYAGLDGLIAIARLPDSDARDAAQAQLSAIVADAGFESADELWRAWRAADAEERLGVPERSERYRAEVWRWIAGLNEFQLRGVDDGRFVLARLGGAAAEALAEALHDEDVYVRVHAAQSLMRMGARGVGAGPELVAALGDPELAPTAAEALGQIGYDGALDPLIARLGEGNDLGLRIASARGLGLLGFPAAIPGLAELREAPTIELRQAALEALIGLDENALGDARALAELLIDPAVDSGSCERALRGWLYARSADDVLGEWDALDPPANVVQSLEEIAARLAARRELALAYIVTL